MKVAKTSAISMSQTSNGEKNGCFQLGCRYKLADGGTKEYFVNPFPHKGKLTMSTEGHASNVREAAAQAQQFYNDHNCP